MLAVMKETIGKFKTITNVITWKMEKNRIIQKKYKKLCVCVCVCACVCVWACVYGDSVCLTPNSHHNVIITPQHVSTAFLGGNLTPLVFSYKPTHSFALYPVNYGLGNMNV